MTLDGASDTLPWYMRETNMAGKRRHQEVTPECRASFYLAWGITPDEQLELERYYDSIKLEQQRGDLEWASRPIFTDY